MESLLGDAAKNVDLKIVSAKEAELENADETADGHAATDGVPGVALRVRGVEDALQIHMNTAALENKTSAL